MLHIVLDKVMNLLQYFIAICIIICLSIDYCINIEPRLNYIKIATLSIFIISMFNILVFKSEINVSMKQNRIIFSIIALNSIVISYFTTMLFLIGKIGISVWTGQITEDDIVSIISSIVVIIITVIVILKHNNRI